MKIRKVTNNKQIKVYKHSHFWKRINHKINKDKLDKLFKNNKALQ